MESEKTLRLYACLRLLRSKPHRLTARKKRACGIRSAFCKQQAKERLLFTFLMSASLVCMHWSPARAVWVKERSSFWWEHVVNCTFTSNDWMENFRMSQSTFTYLCNELRQTIQRRDTVMRKAIPVELRVALTLWRLAMTTNYRTIGHLFGVSKAGLKPPPGSGLCNRLPNRIERVHTSSFQTGSMGSDLGTGLNATCKRGFRPHVVCCVVWHNLH